jgi:signal transduction histidine kinase
MIFAMVNLVLCIFAGSGLMARYVLADNPWLANVLFNWFIFLRLALWVWVSQAFLLPYKAPNWYTLSCRAVYLVTAISLPFIALDMESIPRILMFATILATPIIQIFAIVYTPDMRRSFKTAMISGFLAADALIIAAVYLANSQREINDLSIYFSRLIDFINPVVVLVIVAIQNRLTREDLGQATARFMELDIRADFEKKMLAERRVLIDMLAHELKNPLTSISLAIGSLKMSLPETSNAEHRRLHNISQSIENMDAIIKKCSLMNTVDQKIQNLELEDLKLGAFLKKIIEQEASSQRFKLIDFPEAIIKTDKNLLMVAIKNILENAVKYSVADSDILVEVLKTGLPGGTFRYEIVATNKIHEEWAPDPDLIFNRFYRHPLALQMTGSGLGLYLVDEICRLLGGSVKFNRTADSVKFHIELPA